MANSIADKDLKQLLDQQLAKRVEQIRTFSELQPDHPFTLVNKHMLQLSEETKWNAGGLITMTGVIWWALNLSVDLSPPHTVIFNATGGPDFDFAIFTSVVDGYFLVDPSTLQGTCQFQMEAVSGGLGEVSLNLYDNNWSQIASFVGAAGGLSLSKVAGEGNIKYS
ncbi:hypothetical protein FUA23_01845 [Neolewinella aurantiaca]|uniref:Uncharacterized protein n=1 Tax=Neolewinella aurantiaca TaxID=2602767 RepID=A0A5C7FTN6_9BACT|nr:hypothetical protein [Neolewinella aurantiaca]TXF91461.1 hypothetical protein FUA23_01845 [Neolewinella aurantiaca]